MSEAVDGNCSRSRGRRVTWRGAVRGRGGAKVAAVALGIGLVGWAYGTLVMWAFIALLRSLLGRSGMVGATLVAHVIGAGPRGALTGFVASMGVPVRWQVPLLHIGGRVWPARLVAFRPWLAVVAMVPLLAGVLMGWLVAKAAVRYQISARVLLAASAAGFALIGAGAVLASSVLSSSPLLSLTGSPAWVLPLGAAWAVLGGSLGLLLRAALPVRRRAPRISVSRRVAGAVSTAAVTLLALGAPVIVAGAAEAAACPGTPSACTLSNDGFLTALSPPGTQGLNPSGPSAGQVTNSGYNFQNFLNFVQEPWMVRETNLYWQNNSRMIQLMQASPALAEQAAATLQTWEPALAAVGTPWANTVVITQQMVTQETALANAFINADRASPTGGALAQSIQTEQSKVTPSQVVGLTVNQLVSYLNQHIS